MLVLVFLNFVYVSLLSIFFLVSLLMRIDFTYSMPVVLWKYRGNCWWLSCQSKILDPAEISTNQHVEPSIVVSNFLEESWYCNSIPLPHVFGNRKWVHWFSFINCFQNYLFSYSLIFVWFTLITKIFNAINFWSKFWSNVCSPKFFQWPKVYHAEAFRRLAFLIFCIIGYSVW